MQFSDLHQVINKETMIYIKEARYKIYQNYFDTNNYDSGNFYSVDDIDRDFTTHDPTLPITIYGDLRFQMSNVYDMYEARIYNMYDLFAQLGGAFELSEIFARMWIGYVIQKIFYYSILKSIREAEQADQENTIEVDYSSNNNISRRSIKVKNSNEDRKGVKDEKQASINNLNRF